jgi:3-oxoacyl-[acyl-carrier-protein] synthase II
LDYELTVGLFHCVVLSCSIFSSLLLFSLSKNSNDIGKIMLDFIDFTFNGLASLSISRPSALAQVSSRSLLLFDMLPNLVRATQQFKSFATSTATRATTQRWHKRRVVVTGVGAITPIGADMPTTWDAVLRPNLAGIDSINGGITSLETALALQSLPLDQHRREWELIQSLSCQVAASVNSEWITHHPSSNRLQIKDGRTSRFVQLALIAAQEAVEHSKLDDWLGLHLDDDVSNSSTYRTRRESIGVSVGNGMSSTRDISMATLQLDQSNDANHRSRAHRKISPHFVPRILPNSPSARIAIHNQLLGPNLTHSEACAAGACAIAHGVELIQSGRAMGMVCGGCESAVEALGLIGFSRLRALSSGASGSSCSSDTTMRACSRPFDSSRDGFVLAEGAAMLVLEEHNHAISRGANILAEIIGIGYSGDGFHITAPEPEGKGAARAMRNAALDAGIDMQDVDYINAHATSTPVGDVAEIRAIQLALSQSPAAAGASITMKPLFVSSTKGAMGHLLGASGAIEAAVTTMAVANQVVPHTHNLECVSNEIAQVVLSSDQNIRLVQHKPISQGVDVAMSNSFGFGGTNVSLVFDKYQSHKFK